MAVCGTASAKNHMKTHRPSLAGAPDKVDHVGPVGAQFRICISEQTALDATSRSRQLESAYC